MACRKMKSHAGAKKRFKITGTGRVIAKKEGNNHLLTNKGKNNKKFRYGKELSAYQTKVVKNLLH